MSVELAQPEPEPQGADPSPAPAATTPAPPYTIQDGSPDPAELSERVLQRGRRLTERSEAARGVVQAALREENRAIAELQEAQQAAERQQQQREALVEHILLRKILSVDFGDAGKLLRALRAILESAVAVALTARSGSGTPQSACDALAAVDEKLDAVEARLVKIEVRAAQLQHIGGPAAAAAQADEPAPAPGGEEEVLVASGAAEFASAEALRKLEEVVSQLRAIESSVEFHTALLSAHRSLAGPKAEATVVGGLVYSRSNFSYGSTPHASWLALFEQCEPLRQAVSEMAAG
eukprot:COSAG04_NODE_196_length_20686_cov_2.719823_13_plen_293_part_00